MFMPVITLPSPSKAGLSNPQEITKPPPFFINGSQESFLLKFNSKHDREIEVFDARKYFNEGVALNPSSSCAKISSPADIHGKDELPFKPQPSTVSEWSSNSQSALLSIGARNRRPRKPNRRGFLANYCPCATWNAVDIDCHADESGKPAETGVRDGNQRVKLDRAVIASPIRENRKNGLNLEKKLGLMSWDAIASAEGVVKIPTISNGGDSDSDGSSDLFEIESLQSKSWQPSDGACYPPSEASIEWSVATASAADYSAVSDSECGHAKSGRYNTKGGSPGGILSGCTGQIAVSVGRKLKGDGVSGGGGRLRPPPEGLTGLGTRIRPQSFHGGAPSRSGRAARLLYT